MVTDGRVVPRVPGKFTASVSSLVDAKREREEVVLNISKAVKRAAIQHQNTRDKWSAVIASSGACLDEISSFRDSELDTPTNHGQAQAVTEELDGLFNTAKP